MKRNLERPTGFRIQDSGLSKHVKRGNSGPIVPIRVGSQSRVGAHYRRVPACFLFRDLVRLGPGLPCPVCFCSCFFIALIESRTFRTPFLLYLKTSSGLISLHVIQRLSGICIRIYSRVLILMLGSSVCPNRRRISPLLNTFQTLLAQETKTYIAFISVWVFNSHATAIICQTIRFKRGKFVDVLGQTRMRKHGVRQAVCPI